MTSADKNELISNISKAFNMPTHDSYMRLTIEKISIDKHIINRVTHIDNSEIYNNIFDIPGGNQVKNLINELLASRETISIGNMLIDKYTIAVKNNNQKKISEIIETIKEINGKLYLLHDKDRGVLVNMYINNEITKL